MTDLKELEDEYYNAFNNMLLAKHNVEMASSFYIGALIEANNKEDELLKKARFHAFNAMQDATDILDKANDLLIHVRKSYNKQKD